jgi:hypothetical protein
LQSAKAALRLGGSGQNEERFMPSAAALCSREVWVGCLIVLGAAAVALFSAQDYAGAYNDGSRLATIECLVDYRTLAIDDSVFVRIPPDDGTVPAPYGKSPGEQLENGTLDKIRVHGHFYSDKPLVPHVLLAGWYQVLQWSTGLTARQRPDLFCYWMTVASCGVAYVAALWCTYRLGRWLGLALPLRVLLAASLGLATLALPYLRQVNAHIWLLGVVAALMLNLAGLAEEMREGRVRWPRLVAVGTLAGLGYAIEGGAGPALLACTLALVAYRCRRVGPVALCLLAALPWLGLHHALNYAIGGTFKPANAVPEYFNYPGSQFTAENLTGQWHHAGIGAFLGYARELLIGDRGFLNANLPLFLAVPALVVLLLRRTPQWPEVAFAAVFSGGTWLIYAAFSNNYSGWCCSIRWFVPLLAPAYYVLAVFLRHYPRYGWDLLVLSAWGAIAAGLMWEGGPWKMHYSLAPLPLLEEGAELVRRTLPWTSEVPDDQMLQGAALVSWLICWLCRPGGGLSHLDKFDLKTDA